MIQVTRKSETEFEVTVQGATETTHQVTLSDAYYQKLTKGSETPESLIERSFQFLLQREPNTSILGRFDLPVIGTYFAEYENEIRTGQ